MSYPSFTSFCAFKQKPNFNNPIFSERNNHGQHDMKSWSLSQK